MRHSLNEYKCNITFFNLGKMKFGFLAQDVA